MKIRDNMEETVAACRKAILMYKVVMTGEDRHMVDEDMRMWDDVVGAEAE